MLKYIFLISLSIVIVNSVFSQKELKPSKLKELAESAEIEGDSYSAIYYYELLQEKKTTLATQNKLGNLYTTVRDYEKAKKIYLRQLNTAKNQSDANLYLGISYKHLGKYDSCLFYLNKCNKKKLNNHNAYILKTEYKGAKIAMETPIDTGIIFMNSVPLSINKEHMESAPYFVNDSLIIYASQNVNNDNLYSYTDTLNMPSTLLFYAKKQNKNWVRANELTGLTGLNAQFINIGNGFFSLNKKLFYFTNTIKNWNKKNISQLYVCEYSNGQFKNPVKLGKDINDPFYSTTQPTIGNSFNTNLEIVYFSSDQPGGKGGMDIWFTVFNKKRGTFGVPINAGSRINTILDEITPYYDISTKTLYYSSNGLIGYGGFDVHKSFGELKSWTKPENIGNYLNSNADEIYFRLNNSRNAGFIVTNNTPFNANVEQNFCCFDLQYFTYKNPDQLILKGKLLTKINPIIDKILKSGVEYRDTSLNNNLSDAIVYLYLKTNLGTDSIFIASDTTDINGDFEFNAGSEQEYSLIIEENEEVKAQVEVSTKAIDNITPRVINLDINPIEALPSGALVIKNIYYEFGKSELTNDAKNRLDETLVKLLEQIPDIRIEISSHTDNIGDAEYNMKLSKTRAEKVAKYLISAGIHKNRLITKGYGETDPITPNESPDGSDNPIGRERNRRTEFKIIGKIDSFSGL